MRRLTLSRMMNAWRFPLKMCFTIHLTGSSLTWRRETEEGTKSVMRGDGRMSFFSCLLTPLASLVAVRGDSCDSAGDSMSSDSLLANVFLTSSKRKEEEEAEEGTATTTTHNNNNNNQSINQSRTSTINQSCFLPRFMYSPSLHVFSLSSLSLSLSLSLTYVVSFRAELCLRVWRVKPNH